jgi:hypothetical protein
MAQTFAEYGSSATTPQRNSVPTWELSRDTLARDAGQPSGATNSSMGTVIHRCE